MTIERFVSVENLLERAFFRAILPILVATNVWGVLAFVFLVVPNEVVMGPVQRVFYFHVGSAFATYGMVAVMLVGSCFFLITRKNEWDIVAASSAPVALVFASAVLLSGSIWGHSAWNTWWQWEPRLVSFLVLWFIILSYVLVRSFSAEHARMKNFSAVLGIIAAVNVPIVIYSIELLNEAQQLHPKVVAKQGLKDTRFWIGFIWASISLILFSVWLWVIAMAKRGVEEDILRVERIVR